MGGYHLSTVSDNDYWGNTPLINKPWFINPGLTLFILNWLSPHSIPWLKTSFCHRNVTWEYPLSLTNPQSIENISVHISIKFTFPWLHLVTVDTSTAQLFCFSPQVPIFSIWIWDGPMAPYPIHPRAPLRRGIPNRRFCTYIRPISDLYHCACFPNDGSFFLPSIIQAGKSKTSLKFTVTVYRLGKSCLNDCPHSIPCFKHAFFASFCHNKMPPLGISSKSWQTQSIEHISINSSQSLWFNPQIPVQPERCRA